jgi:SNF2 family DNA or RNA helicase
VVIKNAYADRDFQLDKLGKTGMEKPSCCNEGFSPMAHQLIGGQFIYDRVESPDYGGALVADVNGLGKTAQTLLAIGKHIDTVDAAGGPRNGPCLIVVPANMCRQWLDEIAKYMDMVWKLIYMRSPNTADKFHTDKGQSRLLRTAQTENFSCRTPKGRHYRDIVRYTASRILGT